MFGKIINPLIEKYLNKYIEFQGDQKINLSVWSGALDLNDLLVKPSALDGFGLPIEMDYGVMSKLHLDIPWKSLYSKSIVAKISDLYVICKPKKNCVWNDERETEQSEKGKMNRVSIYETLRARKKAIADKKEKEKNKEKVEEKKKEEKQGWTEYLIELIINNIQISISNVHIRYEDTEKNISIGIILKNLFLKSCNESWEEMFVNIKTLKESIYKKAILNNLSMYISSGKDVEYLSLLGEQVNENGEPLYTKREINKRKYDFMNMIIEDSGRRKPQKPSMYFLRPVEATAKMTKKRDGYEPETREEKKRFAKKADIHLVVDLGAVRFRLDDTQYDSVMQSVGYIQNYALYDQYRRFKPQWDQPIKGNEAKWWTYLLKSSQYEIRKKKYTFDEITRRRTMKDRYITLFKKSQNLSWAEGKVTEEETKDLENLENKMLRYSDIVYLREFAHEEIDREEKIHRKKAANRGYFSSWFGSRDVVTLSEEEKQEMMDDVKKNLVLRSKRKAREDEGLLQEEKAAPSSKMHVVFTMSKAEVNLVDSSKHKKLLAEGVLEEGGENELLLIRSTILRTSLLGVKCHFIKTKDGMNVGITLQDFVAQDFFTEDTNFQNVVCRRGQLFEEILITKEVVLDNQKKTIKKKKKGGRLKPLLSAAVILYGAEADSKEDIVVGLSMDHVDVVVNFEYLKNVMKFFESKSKLKKIEVSEKQKSNVKELGQSQLQASLEIKKVINVRMDIKAPRVIVPMTHYSSNTPIVMANLGKLKVNSILPESKTKKSQRKEKIEKTEGNQEDYYDEFELSLIDFEVFFTNHQTLIEKVKEGKEIVPTKDEVIIDKIGVKLSVKKAIMKLPDLPYLVCGGNIDRIAIHFSPAKMRKLLLVVNKALRFAANPSGVDSRVRLKKGKMEVEVREKHLDASAPEEPKKKKKKKKKEKKKKKTREDEEEEEEEKMKKGDEIVIDERKAYFCEFMEEGDINLFTEDDNKKPAIILIVDDARIDMFKGYLRITFMEGNKIIRNVYMYLSDPQELKDWFTQISKFIDERQKEARLARMSQVMEDDDDDDEEDEEDEEERKEREEREAEKKRKLEEEERVRSTVLLVNFVLETFEVHLSSELNIDDEGDVKKEKPVATFQIRTLHLDVDSSNVDHDITIGLQNIQLLDLVQPKQNRYILSPYQKSSSTGVRFEDLDAEEEGLGIQKKEGELPDFLSGRVVMFQKKCEKWDTVPGDGGMRVFANFQEYHMFFDPKSLSQVMKMVFSFQKAIETLEKSTVIYKMEQPETEQTRQQTQLELLEDERKKKKEESKKTKEEEEEEKRLEEIKKFEVEKKKMYVDAKMKKLSLVLREFGEDFASASMENATFVIGMGKQGMKVVGSVGNLNFIDLTRTSLHNEILTSDSGASLVKFTYEQVNLEEKDEEEEEEEDEGEDESEDEGEGEKKERAAKPVFNKFLTAEFGKVGVTYVAMFFRKLANYFNKGPLMEALKEQSKRAAARVSEAVKEQTKSIQLLQLNVLFSELALYAPISHLTADGFRGIISELSLKNEIGKFICRKKVRQTRKVLMSKAEDDEEVQRHMMIDEVVEKDFVVEPAETFHIDLKDMFFKSHYLNEGFVVLDNLSIGLLFQRSLSREGPKYQNIALKFTKAEIRMSHQQYKMIFQLLDRNVGDPEGKKTAAHMYSKKKKKKKKNLIKLKKKQTQAQEEEEEEGEMFEDDDEMDEEEKKREEEALKKELEELENNFSEMLVDFPLLELTLICDGREMARLCIDGLEYHMKSGDGKNVQDVFFRSIKGIDCRENNYKFKEFIQTSIKFKDSETSGTEGTSDETSKALATVDSSPKKRKKKKKKKKKKGVMKVQIVKEKMRQDIQVHFFRPTIILLIDLFLDIKDFFVDRYDDDKFKKIEAPEDDDEDEKRKEEEKKKKKEKKEEGEERIVTNYGHDIYLGNDVILDENSVLTIGFDDDADLNKIVEEAEKKKKAKMEKFKEGEGEGEEEEDEGEDEDDFVEPYLEITVHGEGNSIIFLKNCRNVIVGQNVKLVRFQNTLFQIELTPEQMKDDEYKKQMNDDFKTWKYFDLENPKKTRISATTISGCFACEYLEQDLIEEEKKLKKLEEEIEKRKKRRTLAVSGIAALQQEQKMKKEMKKHKKKKILEDQKKKEEEKKKKKKKDDGDDDEEYDKFDILSDEEILKRMEKVDEGMHVGGAIRKLQIILPSNLLREKSKSFGVNVTTELLYHQTSHWEFGKFNIENLEIIGLILGEKHTEDILSPIKLGVVLKNRADMLPTVRHINIRIRKDVIFKVVYQDVKRMNGIVSWLLKKMKEKADKKGQGEVVQNLEDVLDDIIEDESTGTEEEEDSDEDHFDGSDEEEEYRMRKKRKRQRRKKGKKNKKKKKDGLGVRYKSPRKKSGSVIVPTRKKKNQQEQPTEESAETEDFDRTTTDGSASGFESFESAKSDLDFQDALSGFESNDEGVGEDGEMDKFEEPESEESGEEKEEEVVVEEKKPQIQEEVVDIEEDEKKKKEEEEEEERKKKEEEEEKLRKKRLLLGDDDEDKKDKKDSNLNKLRKNLGKEIEKNKQLIIVNFTTKVDKPQQKRQQRKGKRGRAVVKHYDEEEESASSKREDFTFSFLAVDDVRGYNVPLMLLTLGDLETVSQVEISTETKIRVDLTFCLGALYWNMKIGTWEPLLERWWGKVKYCKGILPPKSDQSKWLDKETGESRVEYPSSFMYLRITDFRQPRKRHLHKKGQVVSKKDKMKSNLDRAKELKSLNFTVTQAMLETVNTTKDLWSKDFTAKEDKVSREFRAYLIRNHTHMELEMKALGKTMNIKKFQSIGLDFKRDEEKKKKKKKKKSSSSSSGEESDEYSSSEEEEEGIEGEGKVDSIQALIQQNASKELKVHFKLPTYPGINLDLRKSRLVTYRMSKEYQETVRYTIEQVKGRKIITASSGIFVKNETSIEWEIGVHMVERVKDGDGDGTRGRVVGRTIPIGRLAPGEDLGIPPGVIKKGVLAIRPPKLEYYEWSSKHSGLSFLQLMQVNYPRVMKCTYRRENDFESGSKHFCAVSYVEPHKKIKKQELADFRRTDTVWKLQKYGFTISLIAPLVLENLLALPLEVKLLDVAHPSYKDRALMQAWPRTSHSLHDKIRELKRKKVREEEEDEGESEEEEVIEEEEEEEDIITKPKKKREEEIEIKKSLVPAGDDAHRGEDEYFLLKRGKRVEIFEIDLKKYVYMRARIVTKEHGYVETLKDVLVYSLEKHKKPPKDKCVFIKDGSELTVNLDYEIINGKSFREITMYVPYWLINRTSMKLHYWMVRDHSQPVSKSESKKERKKKYRKGKYKHYGDRSTTSYASVRPAPLQMNKRGEMIDMKDSFSPEHFWVRETMEHLDDFVVEIDHLSGDQLSMITCYRTEEEAEESEGEGGDDGGSENWIVSIGKITEGNIGQNQRFTYDKKSKRIVLKFHPHLYLCVVGKTLELRSMKNEMAKKSEEGEVYDAFEYDLERRVIEVLKTPASENIGVGSGGRGNRRKKKKKKSVGFLIFKSGKAGKNAIPTSRIVVHGSPNKKETKVGIIQGMRYFQDEETLTERHKEKEERKRRKKFRKKAEEEDLAKEVEGEEVKDQEETGFDLLDYEPYLFNFEDAHTKASSLDSKKKKISLSLLYSDPTSFFGIDNVGMDGNLVLRSGGQQYDVGVYVSLAPGKYRRTKIVTFTPRFRIVNATESAIYYTQMSWLDRNKHTLPPEKKLKPGERGDFFWFTFLTGNMFIKVRKEHYFHLLVDPYGGLGDSYYKSPPVASHPQFNRKDKEEITVIFKVTLKMADGVTFVVLSEVGEGYYPYVIHNKLPQDKMSVIIQQSKRKLRWTIPYNEPFPYAWETPHVASRTLNISISKPDGSKEAIVWEKLKLDLTRTVKAKTWGNHRVFIRVKIRGPTRIVVIDLAKKKEGLFGGMISGVGNVAKGMGGVAKNVGATVVGKGGKKGGGGSEDDDIVVEEERKEKLVEGMYRLHFKSIGISLVDYHDEKGKKDDRKPRELIYASFDGLGIQFDMSDVRQAIKFDIHRIQIDDQRREIVLLPVVLGMTDKSIEQSLLQISISRNRISGVINYFSVLLQELTAQIDYGFLSDMFQFISVLTSTDDEPGKSEEESKKNELTLFEEPQVEPKDVSMYYFEAFELHPIQLNLTFKFSKQDTEMNSLTKSPLFLLLNSVGFTMINCEEAPLRFNALIMQNPFYSIDGMIGKIKTHYIRQGTTELYKIVGSLDIIGNPVGLFNDVTGGVSDFFYSPLKAQTLDPREVADAFAKGTQSLVQKGMHGAFNAAAKMVGTVEKGVQLLTFDDEYIRSHEQQIMRKPDNFTQGLRYGGAQFLKGLGEGIGGVVMKPIEGTAKQGAWGFLKGAGKGLIGLPTKPFAGALEMAAQTAEGISRMGRKAPMRKRCIRVFREDGAVIPYNPLTAFMHFILSNMKISSRKHRGLVDEIPKFFLDYEGEKKICLLTKSSVSMIRKNQEGYFSVIWYIPHDSILKFGQVRKTNDIRIYYTQTVKKKDELEHLTSLAMLGDLTKLEDTKIKQKNKEELNRNMDHFERMGVHSSDEDDYSDEGYEFDKESKEKEDEEMKMKNCQIIEIPYKYDMDFTVPFKGFYKGFKRYMEDIEVFESVF